MGPTILGCRELRKSLEQGHHYSDVLACPGEVWEGFVFLDDPLVHVASHGTHTPTVSMALHLSLEFRTFLLELEQCFLDLLVSSLQLLYPYARWGPYIPLDLIVEVICWGSPSLINAFDLSLEGTCHETFSRGVMAPPAGVRVRGRL